MSINKKVVKAARMAAGIIFAAFVVATVLKVFWLTPGTFYPFYLALSSTMVSATTPPTTYIWQIPFFEGQYLWSNRLIDTMTLAIVLLATALGASILLREETKQEQEIGAEE